MSQEVHSPEGGSSFRAELMSLRIAGMARSKPCSAVVDEATCSHIPTVLIMNPTTVSRPIYTAMKCSTIRLIYRASDCSPGRF